MIQKDYLLSKAFDPILLGAISLAMAIGLMVIGVLIEITGAMSISVRFPWMAIGALMLFYALFNSIFSLSAGKPTAYRLRSLIAFAGLTILGGLAAYLFSGISIWEAGTFKWILLVVSIGYLVFLALVNLMKIIVEFAMKEEWNHPRMRSRKNRKDL